MRARMAKLKSKMPAVTRAERQTDFKENITREQFRWPGLPAPARKTWNVSRPIPAARKMPTTPCSP